MSVKGIARQQYVEIVDQNATLANKLEIPPEGWLRTVRKALGMSAAQLARRLSVTRGNISNIEKMELTGNVTLKTLQEIAGAMDCRVVYAIIPKSSLEDILEKRAVLKAKRIVKKAGKHMALESQSLSQQQTGFEIERLKQELLRIPSRRLWDDEI